MHRPLAVRWTVRGRPLRGHHGMVSRPSPLLPIVREALPSRIVQLLVGLLLYGIALSLMVRAGLGVAPWDVLSLGIHTQTGIGYGTVTVLVSFVVLVLWLPLRQRLGLGTVLNALLVGPSADLGLWLLPEVESLWIRVPMFVSGLVLLALATGMYIAAAFGPGPRDGLMTGLVRVTRWPIWIVRTILEGSVLLIGFLLGGPVGLGTVAFAFGVGPLVGVFLPWFERRAIARRARWRARRGGAAVSS